MQQHIVSIVRPSGKTGYYLDLFRSRSKGQNEHHDYIYHNIGEKFALHHDGGTALPMNKADDRYKSYPVTMYRVNQEEKTTIQVSTSLNDNGGKYTESKTLRVPGWDYFSGVMNSAPNKHSIYGTFYMDALRRYNHVAMPGGFAREYTDCEAPPIYDAVKPYAAIAKEGKEEKYEELADLRSRLSYPIMVAFEKWMVNEYPKVLPRGRIGQAIKYTYGIYHKLTRYHLDGRPKMDNNLAENAVRPIAWVSEELVVLG